MGQAYPPSGGSKQGASLSNGLGADWSQADKNETLREALVDVVLPFHIEKLDARGRILRCGRLLDAIFARHAYPPAVEEVLAEAIVLCVLMGASLKFEGRFQLQTQSDGVISMVVVDFTPPHAVRAYARFDAEKFAAIAPETPASQLLGEGHLGFSVEQPAQNSRYQGLVALDTRGLVAAAEDYFRQSEQIPTRIMVQTQCRIKKQGERAAWLGGGVFVQFLPQSSIVEREERQAEPLAQEQAWAEVAARLITLSKEELLDPQLDLHRVLFRLFHDYGVAASPAFVVRDECTCSGEKLLQTMKQFSAEAIASIIEADGKIGAVCGFCARSYRLDPPVLE